MSVPLAQRDAALRRFPLRRRDIHVSGGSLRFVAPQSSRALLGEGDCAARCARGVEAPFWADVWPASVCIARQLMRGPELHGAQVCDLGCGIGVAGTAAGVRGAEVRFADREADALAFARFNADLNGVVRHSEILFDWVDDQLPVPCDLLLMADLAYQYRNLPALLRQVRRVVGSGGSALFADPYRASANDLLARMESEFRLEISETSTGVARGRVAIRLAWITRS